MDEAEALLRFTLEGEPRAFPGQTKPEGTFGPEFGGEFQLKRPTLLDRIDAQGYARAFTEKRYGIDAAALDGETYLLVVAWFSLQSITEVRPAWLEQGLDAEDSPDLVQAIMRAAWIARERLAARKKKSAPSGGSDSTTT